MRSHHAAQAGFTLVEAIVAMVLIGGAGMALFGWINSNIVALTRIHEVNLRAEATVNILEYMEKVNPMLTPDGDMALGSYSIHWHSTPTSNVTQGVNYPRGIGLYDLALYSTAISVKSTGGKAWFDLKLQQTGYKKVRTISLQD